MIEREPDRTLSPEIARQMRNFDGTSGDRIDPVAQLCRRLFVRMDLCPCQYMRTNWCPQCVLDHQVIDAAWKATNPGNHVTWPRSV